MTTKLEQNLAALQGRLEQRKAEQASTQAGLDELGAKLADVTDDGDRSAIFAEFGQLSQEAALLEHEIAELEKRERAARVAILEAELQQAEKEHAKTHAIMTAARADHKAALEAVRVAQNGGDLPEGRDAATLYLADLRTAEIKAQAQLAIAGRAAQRTGRALQDAQQALEQAEAA